MDAYLVALTCHDAALNGKRHKEVTRQECRATHDALKEARKQYWDHVECHRCRVTSW